MSAQDCSPGYICCTSLVHTVFDGCMYGPAFFIFAGEHPPRIISILVEGPIISPRSSKCRHVLCWGLCDTGHKYHDTPQLA